VQVAQDVATGCGGIRLGAAAALDGGGSTSVHDDADDGLGGGGICAESGATLSDLTVANNDARNSGGGILGVDVVLTGLTVTGNHSDLGGGGLYASGAGETTITDCTFEKNEATIDGGGVAVTQAVTITNSAFRNNDEDFFASKGGGAGIDATGVLTSVDTEWTGNTDSDVGMGTVGVNYGGVASFVCDGATQTCQ
jgi:predicted outer membrane repeat protein